MSRISVVVPVRNGLANLQATLAALRASERPPDEILVMDDGSSDETVRIDLGPGIRRHRVPDGPRGPGAARNLGAKLARGQIVFFVDSDVELHPDALGRVEEFFDRNPEHAACFGAYDTHPAARNFISQYRNLLHHFVHRSNAGEASTFWAGCGAVRRDVFLEIGGFDERYGSPMIEDIDLGVRLRDAGHRIALVPEIQGSHRKRWTAFSMIRTDIRSRAIPWTRLILERRDLPRVLNLKMSARVSAALAWTAVAAACAGFFLPRLWPAVPAALLGVVALNFPFYRFLLEERGFLFALASFPWHVLYFLYSSATFALVTAAHVLGMLRPAAAPAAKPLPFDPGSPPS